MRSPLADVGDEGQQRDVPSPFDGHSELPLVWGTGTGYPTGDDFSPVRHKASKAPDILVVYVLQLVHTEFADFFSTIALPSLEIRHWYLSRSAPWGIQGPT
jgi:hypothetical protein